MFASNTRNLVRSSFVSIYGSATKNGARSVKIIIQFVN